MNSFGGMVAALIVGVDIAIIGFCLGAHGGNVMGSTLFIVTPVATGFALALLTRSRVGLLSVLTLTFVISMGLLFIYRLESLLCVIISTPVLLVFIAIGAATGVLLRRKTRLFPYERNLRILILLAIPFVLEAADWIERPILIAGRQVSIVDAIEVHAGPELVWKELNSIERITVPKPWLMYVGLYEPVGCETSKMEVGGVRTCHFRQGAIYERVDVCKPAAYMHLSIFKSTLPGRPWLDYVDAEYRLIRHGDTTIVERTTRITSRLGPAWYWQYFERMGVSAEHQYVLAEIKKRVEVASQVP